VAELICCMAINREPLISCITDQQSNYSSNMQILCFTARGRPRLLYVRVDRLSLSVLCLHHIKLNIYQIAYQLYFRTERNHVYLEHQEQTSVPSRLLVIDALTVSTWYREWLKCYHVNGTNHDTTDPQRLLKTKHLSYTVAPLVV